MCICFDPLPFQPLVFYVIFTVSVISVLEKVSSEMRGCVASPVVCVFS